MRSGATILALLAACALATPGCGGGGGEELQPYVVIHGEQVIAVGQTTRLFADTLHGTGDTYMWTSEDPVCATVSDDGLVAALSEGQTLIHVRGVQSGLEAVCRITVVPGAGAGIPNYEAWRLSAHGNASSPAFRVWDAVGEVPADCARCHSTYGFRDWIGDDGSPAGVVDDAPPTGSTVECVACHSSTAEDLETVVFPSGAEHTGQDRDVLCMQCHGGRGSTDELDRAIIATQVPNDDTVADDLWLRTPHYQVAGATRLGGRARGGYQYAGRSYDARFAHVGLLSSCTDCHDPHSLGVDYTRCETCHPDATSAEGVRDIRMHASLVTDYDGDGDLDEGMAGEIDTLLALLQDAVRAYAADVVGRPVAFRPNPAPNFYEDLNANGVLDAAEDAAGNQYTSWTARLVRAAYNIQFAMNDRGAHVHNAKYVVQLLYDSILDVNSALPTPLDVSALVRNDRGHFDGSAKAARHWDEDETVEAACARCHSGRAGFLAYLDSGVNLDAQPLANGLECEVCHSAGGSPGLRSVDAVEFPGGHLHQDPGNASLLCMPCHTGRASKATIDAAIAVGDLSFQNVHYLPAAGVLLGSEAAIGYEYAGHSYAGARDHVGGSDCLDCHGGTATRHTFDVEIGLSACTTCHVAETVDDLRMYLTDYDGDGDAAESLAGEIETLAGALLTRIQTVANAAGDPVAYDAHAYPYFFHDTDGDGVAAPGEAIYANRYQAWTAPLLKAAHNYQIARKEPGAWAHNLHYVLQLLIDAIEDLGGTVDDYVRPAPG